MYRYLSLEESANVAYFLAITGRGGKQLMKQLELFFIKHRKAISMDDSIKRKIQCAYDIVGCSDTLVASLEDPNIEVPSVDTKIPKMDRVEGGDPKRARISNKENLQISHH